MKKDDFDNIIKAELKADLEEIKMDDKFREIIIKNTVKSKDTLQDKLVKILNKTVEIPVKPLIALCMIVLIIVIPLSIVSFRRYNIQNDSANVQIINSGSFQIVYDRQSEVKNHENGKN